MKLPRDITAEQFIQALARLGYQKVRQTGSHIRICTQQQGEHHETVPAHSPLKAGTLTAILRGIASHHGLTRDQLLEALGL